MTVGWLPAPVGELFGPEATAEESYEVLTVDVPPTAWLPALETARDSLGCTYFDWLSAVDEPGTGFRVAAHVVALSPVRRLLVRTTVPHSAPVLATAVSVYAGAGWHERETHEMFGVIFEGHPGLDPLLLPEGFEGHPPQGLRPRRPRRQGLARGEGAGESDHGGPKRRQMLPPGVPDPNEWGPLKGQLPRPPPARRAERPEPPATARCGGPARRARARQARPPRLVAQEPVPPPVPPLLPPPVRRPRRPSSGAQRRPGLGQPADRGPGRRRTGAFDSRPRGSGDRRADASRRPSPYPQREPGLGDTKDTGHRAAARCRGAAQLRRPLAPRPPRVRRAAAGVGAGADAAAGAEAGVQVGVGAGGHPRPRGCPESGPRGHLETPGIP